MGIVVGLGVFVFFAFLAAISFKKADASDKYMGVLLVLGLVLSLGSLPAAIFGGNVFGAFPDYQSGSAVGVVVDASKGGLVWETNDFQFAYATDTRLPYQKMINFTVVDEQKAQELDKLKGRLIRIYYKSWFLARYDQGTSGNVVYNWEAVE